MAEFFSPLESALLQWNDREVAEVLSPVTSYDDLLDAEFEEHDEIPEWASEWPADPSFRNRQFDASSGLRITSEQDATTRRLRKKSSVKRIRSATHLPRPNPLVNPVMEKIDSVPEDSDFDMDIIGGGKSATPWAKLLLLEELGTASSWAILLIPYIAFLISLALDTYSSLLVQPVGPLNANSLCPVDTSRKVSQTAWLHFTNGTSCSYPFSLQEQERGLHNYEFQSFRYRSAMRDGWAFVSGPILDVPPMSGFLRGDSYFNDLSTETASLVAQGRVVYSTVVMQRYDGHWAPVSTSKPQRLSMACTVDTKSARPESRWHCVSPRIIDVLFSLPGTGILSGEELQIVTLFSPKKAPSFARDLRLNQYAYDDAVEVTDASYVYSDTPGSSSLLFSTRANTTHLEDLIKSSTYTIEHESLLYAQINIAVRLGTLLITTVFLVLWCRALGVKGVLGCGCCASSSCCQKSDPGTYEERLSLTQKHAPTFKFWWESPWIVFPERRYLLVLLFCLILLQNPLLACAYFYPVLYRSPNVHAAADCIIGVGVFGILMILHCLFHGLRYHTADVTRRRAKQQRQVLELRRVANYMAKTDSSTNPATEDATSRYIADYYETYGDVDGNGYSALDSRLRHDPCGHDWPDFLLPKLLLFFVSITSVIMASVYRFPVATTRFMSQEQLHHYNKIYITSSFIQLFVAFMWMVLICRQAMRTGWMLRKEPFLSTRPAQLAYRICVSILFLALVALVVPFFVDLYVLCEKWTFHGGADEDDIPDDLVIEDQEMFERSTIDVMLSVLAKVSERFPYSGTAASIGPGKIVYATVCGLIAAFIFLPSAEVSNRRNRPSGSADMFSTLALDRKRDKRLVVTLARYTQSWRIFPLPIQKVSLATSLLKDVSFKLGPSERSLTFFGRYTPVFCLEVACWLLEASWQAYYAPQEFVSDDSARMSLESVGLKMERCILDKSTDAQVFVATNMYSQVDGEEDSIIVVSFRGTANATNLALDMKWRQVPLLDQIIGLDDFPMFQVTAQGVNMNDSGDWFWDTPFTREAVLKSFAPASNTEGCSTFTCNTGRETNAGTAFTLGAKAVLAATPVARRTLPCVHEGFLIAYSHLRKQLLECVLEVMQRQLTKAIQRANDGGSSLVLPKVYVTGHSMGGSVGQLFALDLASNCVIEVPTDHMHSDELDAMEEDVFHLPSADQYIRRDSGFDEVFLSPFDDKKWFHQEGPESEVQAKTLRLQPAIALYSYGQPRVGNHAFSRLYKQRVPHTFRVVNEGDALTTLPNTVMLGGQYKQAGLEVMLDEGCTGNIIVGPTVVETMFRFSKVRTSVAAHGLDRYRKNLQSGLTEDELHEYYRGHGFSKTSSAQQSNEVLPDWMTKFKRSNSKSYV